MKRLFDTKTHVDERLHTQTVVETYISDEMPSAPRIESAYALIHKNNDILHIRHINGSLDLPGRHIRAGENIQDILKKEILETTGIHIYTMRFVAYRAIHETTIANQQAQTRYIAYFASEFPSRSNRINFKKKNQIWISKQPLTQPSWYAKNQLLAEEILRTDKYHNSLIHNTTPKQGVIERIARYALYFFAICIAIIVANYIEDTFLHLKENTYQTPYIPSEIQQGLGKREDTKMPEIKENIPQTSTETSSPYTGFGGQIINFVRDIFTPSSGTLSWPGSNSGSSSSSVVTQSDSRNPCDPSIDISNAEENNLVRDPYFTKEIASLPFNPNNGLSESAKLDSGIWYATKSPDAIVSRERRIPDNNNKPVPMPRPEDVKAVVETKGALKLAPSESTALYAIQKIGLKSGDLNKEYEFRICVFGDSDLAPLVSISGTGLAITKAEPSADHSKSMSYLAGNTPDEAMILPKSLDPQQKARTQNLYWTLHRFVLGVAKNPNDSSDPYLVISLSGWKNQYDADYPIQWFMRPVIREATPTTYTYVPPATAFWGHALDGTPNQISLIPRKIGEYTEGLALIRKAFAQTVGPINLLSNSTFSDGFNSWNKGIASEGQSTTTSGSGITFTHAPTSPDTYTMTVSQAIQKMLPANSTYAISAEFSGNASAYITLGNHVPSDARLTGTTTYDGSGSGSTQATFTTGATAIKPGIINFVISSYKDQVGKSVTVRNVRFYGVYESESSVEPKPIDPPPPSGGGVEKPKEKDVIPPQPEEKEDLSGWPLTVPRFEGKGFVDDFTKYQSGQALNRNIWLLPNKSWGGDNHGVRGENVMFRDIDSNNPLSFLRLYSFGGTDRQGKSLANGREQRTGAAIVTNDYYGSGSYFVCAKLPKSTGVVSAFWPFHYIDYKPDEPGYWLEPNKIRNTEIDWEFPTSDESNSVPPTYTLARANSWGGQLGGEGGNDSLRIVYPQGLNDGKFHQFGIVWYTGRDNPDKTRTPGFVKWTYAENCTSNPTLENPNAIANSSGYRVVKEITGAKFGQDNIPFRVARFWIGAWFPVSDSAQCSMDGNCTAGYTAGGKKFMGWGGTPNFVKDPLDIAWVGIYPFKSILPGSVTNMSSGANPSSVSGTRNDMQMNDIRDYWTPETVPMAGNWTGTKGTSVKDYPKK